MDDFLTAETLPEEEAAALAGHPEGLPERYEDLGALDSGGMGEIRRVRDRLLDQHLALKLTLRPLAPDSAARRRFLREARITARLKHPAIVSVHDLGALPDGRLWFTMREVEGRTLRDVIRGARAGETGDPASAEEDRPDEPGGAWSLRRLVAAYEAICGAVAYAHAQGIVHRDLKPGNVMVGAFGEVQVMDWGLARDLRQPDPIHDLLGAISGGQTVQGAVIGTPAYMPPEQARGETDRLGPTADVYSLGAILYELLCGEAPYARDAERALRQVLAGPPAPLAERASAWPIPEELAALTGRCMARDPADRPAHAGAITQTIRSWLDGAERRAQALVEIAAADRVAPQIQRLRDEAAALRAEAKELLTPLPPYAPEDQKRPAWDRLACAERAERDAATAEADFEHALHAALRRAPDLSAPRDRLADHYRSRLAEAESRRDPQAAARSEALLRAYDRGRHAGWLQGDGALTLVTDPPGATVEVRRYVTKDRRLVDVHEATIGPTPLREHPLARGSYLLILSAPGRAPVRYPVAIDRQEHWHGVPPGGDGPAPIWLPPEGALGPDDLVVPAGWFTAGGDPDAPDGLPARRLWVDGFVVKRHPVTNGEFLGFLNDLVAAGRRGDAERWAPQNLEYERDRPRLRRLDGGFALGIDGEGEPLSPDHPATLVTWHAALAYSAWRATQSPLRWRLLHDHEWEKVARGADTRRYPWGDFLDPTWTRMHLSARGKPGTCSVEDYPLDASPYGARGLAGNARSWCNNHYDRAGPAGPSIAHDDRSGDPMFRMMRGGYNACTANSCRAAARLVGRPADRYRGVGFRLASSLTPASGHPAASSPAGS